MTVMANLGARAEINRRECRSDGREKVRGWQRPVKVSLGLLPSGPDPVGEEHVRANLSIGYIGHRGPPRKGGNRHEIVVRTRPIRRDRRYPVKPPGEPQMLKASIAAAALCLVAATIQPAA